MDGPYHMNRNGDRNERSSETYFTGGGFWYVRDHKCDTSIVDKFKGHPKDTGHFIGIRFDKSR